jgi:hypothetical protein
MEDEQKGIELDVGGIKVNLKSYWLAVIVPVVGTILGALWGGFELYSQFIEMKEATAAYVAPDLSTYDERLAVLLERMDGVERLTRTNKETLDYISGNLQTGINNAVRTADAVDTRTRTNDKDTQDSINGMQNQIREFDRNFRAEFSALESTVDDKLAKLQLSVDSQIKETLANPLAERIE